MSYPSLPTIHEQSTTVKIDETMKDSIAAMPDTKYVIPENVTMASVQNHLVSSTPKVRAPIYPALDSMKPLVFYRSKANHDDDEQRRQRQMQHAPPPLTPLLDIPHVPLRRYEHDERNAAQRDEQLHQYQERMRKLEHNPNHFYRAVEAYLYSEHKLRQARTALDDLERAIQEKRMAGIYRYIGLIHACDVYMYIYTDVYRYHSVVPISLVC
jgi:hypothetical protein